jgi:hypothetical protein
MAVGAASDPMAIDLHEEIGARIRRKMAEPITTLAHIAYAGWSRFVGAAGHVSDPPTDEPTMSPRDEPPTTSEMFADVLDPLTGLGILLLP